MGSVGRGEGPWCSSFEAICSELGESLNRLQTKVSVNTKLKGGGGGGGGQFSDQKSIHFIVSLTVS